MTQGRVVVLGAIATLTFCSALQAQTKTEEREVIEVSYYKIKGGLKSEWLELYKKNHLPILRDHQKAGLILNIEIYEIAFHEVKPGWDYKVVQRMKNWSALDEMEKRAEEVRKRLYPSKEQFDREENRRWEITEQHWDEVVRPVKIEEG